MKQLVAIGLFIAVALNCNAVTISIIASDEVFDNSITSKTIADCQSLLQQVFGTEVTLNNDTADVLLILPIVTKEEEERPTRFSVNKDYPYMHYPDHDHLWSSSERDGHIILTLSTRSHHGISFGLYGLLQEKLGILFVHPKQTIIPNYNEWPLPSTFKWESKARFDKKGFHLHTMHPTELTEQLLDESRPNALEDIIEYLDWLVRNRQNYFEFNLLEGIDHKKWPAHAKAFVDYGHSRGLIMGVDVSLHMVQQKAYMLYQNWPANWRKKEKQIEKNLAWLFQADWDLVNMEFSTTEFSEGNPTKKEKMRLFINDLITNKYGAKLMGREHVVQKQEMMTGKDKHNEYVMTEAEKELDSHRGILIHTVMFYTATEEKAPVYQNKNLKHMMDKLHHEQKVRETWYYPESAYWITFDISEPMFHLPYLSARLNDIDTMEAHGVPGHITFSSGWEWGYWSIDWSIARWSWSNYDYVDGEPERQEFTPTDAMKSIFNDKPVVDMFNEQLDIQQEYLKDKDLMRYMAAAGPTDEIAGKISLEFQPRPQWRYRYMRKKADRSIIDQVRKEGVNLLNEYADASLSNIAKHKADVNGYLQSTTDTLKQLLLTELVAGLQITAMRAEHRALTLDFLLDKRIAKLDGTAKNDSIYKLALAYDLRQDGLQLVKSVEQHHYRYPIELIARKRKGQTAYHFGYLYLASYLHFWAREECQVKNDKYGPFYRLVWNIPRIVGIIN